MTLKEFLIIYRCEFKTTNQDNINIIFTSKVIRRSDNFIVDKINISIDYYESNNWVNDSQSVASLHLWDWTKLIDQYKRYQLDYFAQRARIVDYFPMNSEVDISNMYL